MADAQLPELYAKRMRLHLDNVDLLKRVQADGRDHMTGDEETTYNATDEAMEGVSRTIDKIEKNDRIAALLDQKQDRQTAAVKDLVDTRQVSTSTLALRQLRHGSEDWDLAFRGWLLNNSSQQRPEYEQAAKRIGWDLRSREVEINFSRRPLKSTTPWDVKAWKERAQTVTTTGGGYTVPDDVMQPLEEALLWFGPMRQTSTIVRTERGSDLPWPTVNDTAVVGEILGINTTVNTGDMVFGQTVFKSFKYSSKAVLVPVELMQDTAVNLPELIGRALGTRIGRIQNTHFTTGAGTTLPFGIVVSAAAGPAPTGSATAAGFSYPNLVDLEHSVDIAYRRMGASFMCHDLQVARLKKLLGTDGRPLWQPAAEAGMASGAPSTLLGYPLWVNNDMASVTTTTTKGLLFGALQEYMIREVLGINLLRLDERYADSHQVGFIAFSRADGNLLNAGTNPVKYMSHTT